MKIGHELELRGLAAGAPTPAPGASAPAKEVASQFEGLLLNELFKTMRRTVPESPFFGGFSQDVYTGMLDEQLAQAAAQGGGLGLASVLQGQLGEPGERPGVSAGAPGLAAGVPGLAAGLSGAFGAPLSAETAAALADGHWVRPVDESAVRPSEAQSFGASRPGHRHVGLDLAPGEGAPVRAAGDGVVTAVSRDPGTKGGLTVEVSHQGGRVVTRYLHLEDIRPDLKVGDAVSAGDELGSVGNTGTASRGAHLHFELEEHLPDGRKNHLDPRPYVQRWPMAGR